MFNVIYDLIYPLDRLFTYYLIQNIIYERASLVLASRGVMYFILATGLRPSVWGKVTSDDWNLRNLHYSTRNICYVILSLIYSQSARPISQVSWNHVFVSIQKFVFFLVVNNNKYLPHVVENIMFGISVPDYPIRTVENNSLRLFWNFGIFCLLYIHVNILNLRMRNSKLRNLVSVY